MEERDQSVITRLKEVMNESGLNQSEFSSEVKVAQPTISAIYNLKRNADPLVDAVSKRYGISKQWLLTGMGIKYLQKVEEMTDDSLKVLSNNDRAELLRRLNLLYERHQAIMSEEQEIMMSIVELNRKLILDGADIAGE